MTRFRLGLKSNAFAGGNITANSIKDACEAMVGGDATAPKVGGSLVINGETLAPYDYVLKRGAQVVSSVVDADWFTATQDSRAAFVIVDGDLTINAALAFVPAARKPFTVIYVRGNLIVNGHIGMSGRGANHGSAGSNLTAGSIRIANGTFTGVLNPQVPAVGAPARAGATNASGFTGNAGTAGGTGSGGGGGGSVGTGGLSAGGTAYSGGGGGGPGSGLTGGNAQPNGGQGGHVQSTGNMCGASAGNPAGLNGVNGQSGTGGVLIIIVTGFYSGTGSVYSAGLAGGSHATQNSAAVGGSGSGGGHVTLLIGAWGPGPTPTAPGGAAGTVPVFGSAVQGAAGGAGTARVLALLSTTFDNDNRVMVQGETG